MLNDPERKLLRILNNIITSRKPIPTYHELFRMTGRNEKMIMRSLNALQDTGFIKWDGMFTQSVVVLNGWEEQPASPNNRTYHGRG